MVNQYDGLEARIVALEEKVAQITKQLKKSKRANRKPREYTDEQRAAIRARLLAGQEAAKKKHEAEGSSDKPASIKTVKSKKDKGSNSEKVKVTESEKPTEA